jgi:hypothetical protein
LKKQHSQIIPPWKENLLSLDLRETKKTAYTLTKWGLRGVDSDEKKALYEDLSKALERYKYKQNVEPFDKLTRTMIITFIHEVTHV